MSVYAVSDLHGCLNLWNQITNFLEEDDKVYVLGDCVDRGPEPWETFKKVAKDSRTIILKGNHEYMIEKACEEFYKYEGEWGWGENYRLSIHNGGHITLMDWECDEDPRGWYNYIKKLPAHATYVNAAGYTILLSHAGYTPIIETSGNLKKVSFDNLIWDREHCLDEWEEGDEFIVVHGHTPIPLLVDELNLQIKEVEPGAFWYCDNHKICIDNGSVWTGYTCLLDLDTFKEYIFSETNLKENIK